MERRDSLKKGERVHVHDYKYSMKCARDYYIPNLSPYMEFATIPRLTGIMYIHVVVYVYIDYNTPIHIAIHCCAGGLSCHAHAIPVIVV